MIARVPDGSVLITGADLAVARYAVNVTLRHRRRQGLPDIQGLARLGDALAEVGQTDTEPEASGEAEYMTVDEAARRLSCSARSARRLAERLGGRKLGGRWLIDTQAVQDHLQGTERTQ